MLPKTRRRDRRTWLVGALALAGWLTASLTGFASPALARTCGSITITGGTVSPGTGTPTTTFTFAVTVSDTTGTAPAWVRVRVHGTWSDLAPTGSDWTGGVLYTGTRELPVGSWGYVFRARTSGEMGVIADLPIWQHKIHRTRPLLCDGDGPILAYRKWFEQFYVYDDQPQRVAAE